MIRVDLRAQKGNRDEWRVKDFTGMCKKVLIILTVIITAASTARWD